jgi:Zn-dependent peptidase ImmA (M78 family)
LKAAEDLHQELRRQYGGALPFTKICDDESIIVVKAKLDDGVNSFYMSCNGVKLIVLNAMLTRWERRDAAFHELYHHFRSPDHFVSKHHSTREEQNAELFAALCRVPVVLADDDIESIRERCNVSRTLAKLRIEHEIKKLAR